LQRVLTSAALVGLLIATAAAFAITERLKLVKSPIYGTHVSKRVSPTCGCARGKAGIRVTMRSGDDVTITIRDAAGHLVDTLAAGEYVPRGPVRFVWDGKTDLGKRAPDGAYQPEIHFARQHRTILLPNRIVLDTHPPKVLSVTPSRDTISPDGDNVGDSIKVSYRFNSPARAALYLGSRRIELTRGHKPKGTFTWHGSVDGKPLARGTYTLYLGGIDEAGNLTPPNARRQLFVRVRYIQLLRDRIVLKKPGVRFGVGVDTDAPFYLWSLDGVKGVSTEPVLRVHAPDKPGTYALVVSERGHSYRSTVVVEAATKK
jgi:hypothetical protein